jgi:hypothetical protein
MVFVAGLVAAALLAGGPAPGFQVEVGTVSRAELRWSWRPGCPVAPHELRLLRIPYWGFDGRRHVGRLVVRASAADAIVSVFALLYGDRFPIRRMVPVDVYRGSDERSMAADNTSAFNCRPVVAPGPKRWSVHAYGEAIDVNPVENPYVLGGRARPAAGARYVDRTRRRPGMAEGALVRAFASVGWGWGGRWGAPDYQHFSSTGG